MVDRFTKVYEIVKGECKIPENYGEEEFFNYETNTDLSSSPVEVLTVYVVGCVTDNLWGETVSFKQVTESNHPAC